MNGVWLGPMEQYGPRSANDISYSGSFVFWRDGKNWEIALKSGSNTALTFLKKPGKVDLFLVDGGKPGNIGPNDASIYSTVGGKGGDGGKVRLIIGVDMEKECLISIGQSGGFTSLSTDRATYTTDGGETVKTGGEGGSAASGSIENAKAGEDGYKAFLDDTALTDFAGHLFGSSGGGAGARTIYDDHAKGAKGGATEDGEDPTTYGAGAHLSSNDGFDGYAGRENHGQGGGGAGEFNFNTSVYDGVVGAGGSGVIFIRNHRTGGNT